LGILLFCVIAYGIFYFAVNLLGVNRNANAFVKVSGRIEGTEYHAAAKVAGKATNFGIEEAGGGGKLSLFFCWPGQ
jgi:uncharacterized membrane protein (UPF0136 family)